MEQSYELLDCILSGSAPEDISDKIKEILYTKSAENIETITPSVAQSLFGSEEQDDE